MKPNFVLLNNAIRQTQGKGHDVSESEFKQTVLKHLESIDFTKIKSDVERFVLNREELKFLNREAVLSLLRNYE